MTDATSLPGYLIAQIRIRDFSQYIERYAQHVLPLIARHGGEVLVASPSVECKEGEWPANWTVVIRFPSLQILRDFYAAPEYAPLKALRIDELTDGCAVVLAEGFDPAALAAGSFPR